MKAMGFFFIFLLSILPAKIYKFIYLPAMIADIFGLFMVKSFETVDLFLSSYDIFQGLLIPMCHFLCEINKICCTTRYS